MKAPWLRNISRYVGLAGIAMIIIYATGTVDSPVMLAVGCLCLTVNARSLGLTV